MLIAAQFHEEVFRRGGTLYMPFLLVGSGGVIANISDGVVTAVVQPYGGAAIDLTVGNGGIVLEDPAPRAAPNPDNQEPHGYVLLTPAQTQALPLDSLTEVTVLFVNSAGIRMHSQSVTLRGVA